MENKNYSTLCSITDISQPLHHVVQETPKKPNEIPQPGITPETAPSKEPEPSVWPNKEPEIQPGPEPLSIPPPAPTEIPQVFSQVLQPGSRVSVAAFINSYFKFPPQLAQWQTKK